MNWTKASAMAEIVSSAAILATLVYLAIQTQQVATQTQQNTAAIISNSRNQTLNADLQLLRMTVDYPVTSPTEAVADNPDDAIRQGAFDVAIVETRGSQWLQFQDGQLDEATWRLYLSALVSYIKTTRRMGEQWKNVRQNPIQFGLDPEFVAAVDDQLAE